MRRIIIFTYLLVGFCFGFSANAQFDYFAPIAFKTNIGGSVKDPGGLRVSCRINSQKTVSVASNTLDGQALQQRNAFTLLITVTNDGPDDVIISDWAFRAICPQNSVGLPWQENASVPLITPAIPFDQNLLLKPGEKKIFPSAETDFYWCLPKDEQSLLEAPKYLTAIISCAKVPAATSSGTNTSGTNKTNPNRPSGKPKTPLDELEPPLLDLIDAANNAYANGDQQKGDDYKQQAMGLAAQIYPDHLKDIVQLMQKNKGVRAVGQTDASNPQPAIAKNAAGNPGAFSNWLFLNSDKAVQARYRLEKTENGIGYFSVQLRINFDDTIFCSDAQCLGYLFTFSYPSLDNAESVYYHFKMYNTYKQIYTLPDLMPLKLEFDDGSRRMLKKEGFFYTTANFPNPQPADQLFYNCVDNILSGDGRHRCSGGWRNIYKESEATILK